MSAILSFSNFKHLYDWNIKYNVNTINSNRNEKIRQVKYLKMEMTTHKLNDYSQTLETLYVCIYENVLNFMNKILFKPKYLKVITLIQQ